MVPQIAYPRAGRSQNDGGRLANSYPEQYGTLLVLDIELATVRVQKNKIVLCPLGEDVTGFTSALAEFPFFDEMETF
jgi:hypothetical protein